MKGESPQPHKHTHSWQGISAGLLGHKRRTAKGCPHNEIREKQAIPRDDRQVQDSFQRWHKTRNNVNQGSSASADRPPLKPNHLKKKLKCENI